MNAQAAMTFVGEIDGKMVYWAEPGRFTTPGIYYWNGTNNVHVPLAAAPSPTPGVTRKDDELCAKCSYTYAGHISNTGCLYPCWTPSGKFAPAKPEPTPIVPNRTADGSCDVCHGTGRWYKFGNSGPIACNCTEPTPGVTKCPHGADWSVSDCSGGWETRTCNKCGANLGRHRSENPRPTDDPQQENATRPSTEPTPPVEAHFDDIAVDAFAAMMKAKLAKKRAEGYGGWDNPDECSVEFLRAGLMRHLQKGDPVDVANFCMMLRHYDASTAPTPPVEASNETLGDKLRDVKRMLAVEASGREGDTLWCLHIEGPDDVHPAPSKAYAEAAALLFNARFGPVSKETDVLIRAVVAPWPHSPESHAETVDRFALDFLVPQGVLRKLATPSDEPSSGEADGAALIAAERRRQQDAEGWTPEHDDEHDAGALATAGACYAMHAAGIDPLHHRTLWPWAAYWWKPSDDRVRDLTKSGALIAAEIDRINRRRALAAANGERGK